MGSGTTRWRDSEISDVFLANELNGCSEGLLDWESESHRQLLLLTALPQPNFGTASATSGCAAF
jgi:hypothetical protein